jgi:hypothetical protein
MATSPRFSNSPKRMTPAEMGVRHKAAQEQLKQDAADRRAAAEATRSEKPRTRTRRPRG